MAFLQASVGLVISLLLLVDLSLTLLTLLQYYSISTGAILIVVIVLPLISLLPSAAGLNALFSHGPRRSASLARVYALWNTTAIVNMVCTQKNSKRKTLYSLQAVFSVQES
jgi:hypothetical protein